MSTTRPNPFNTPPQPDGELVDAAVEAMAGATALGYGDEKVYAEGITRLARASMQEPPKVWRRTAGLWLENAKILTGSSAIKPEDDKRFAGEAWTNNPLYRLWGQSYLAWSEAVHGLVEELKMEPKERMAARFAANLTVDALAPTNLLAGNPEAIREAARSGGRSIVNGLFNFVRDLRDNNGMPAMVDTEPFVVGETIATTPGHVVYRSDVFELIRYAPTTAEVHERPLVVVPPQINKYYILDLAEGRSLAQAAVDAGHQVFMISWRNPTPEHRDWNLDTYCQAASDAIDAARELAGHPDVNLLGVCAGGMTSAALLGHMAARSDRRVNSATFLVASLDWAAPSTVSSFTAGPMVFGSIQQSRARGILPGRDLARFFAWLRPNDLVWNYWVNNYLLGRKPPAFDILAWNADSTNLTAGLHADFLHVASENLLARHGDLVVLDEKVDLASVTTDNYVVAGITDHIIPWEGCYQSVHLLGGPSEFVLCKSGHIQTLVCPPDNPKAKYLTNSEHPSTAEDWLAGATEHKGSWWEHWLGWLGPRGGERIVAPTEPGSASYPVHYPAPGTYVTE